MLPETRTYVGQTSTAGFDGYAGLRIGQRYTGSAQDDGTVLVALVGAALGSGVRLTAQQWAQWFK